MSSDPKLEASCLVYKKIPACSPPAGRKVSRLYMIAGSGWGLKKLLGVFGMGTAIVGEHFGGRVRKGVEAQPLASLP